MTTACFFETKNTSNSHKLIKLKKSPSLARSIRKARRNVSVLILSACKGNLGDILHLK